MQSLIPLKASTKYKIEAYGPIELADVARTLLTLGTAWKGKLADLAQFQIEREGNLYLPIVPILGLFKRVPPVLLELLYSRPLWQAGFTNLVVTTGLTDIIDKYFKGASYTAAHYVLLLSATPTVAAGDTMSSHTGWTEVTAYSQSTRVAPTWGTAAAGSVDNSASKAQFSINGTATVGGAGLATNSTKGGTTGTFYGGGAFTEGDRPVFNGDTINVQVTATATG